MIFEKFLYFRPFMQGFDIIYGDDLSNAYYLKEKYTIFNRDSSYEVANNQYEDILNEFISSNIKEFKNFITILKNRKIEILNSFIRYECGRINNGVAKGINSTIS